MVVPIGFVCYLVLFSLKLGTRDILWLIDICVSRVL